MGCHDLLQKHNDERMVRQRREWLIFQSAAPGAPRGFPEVRDHGVRDILHRVSFVTHTLHRMGQGVNLGMTWERGAWGGRHGGATLQNEMTRR